MAHDSRRPNRRKQVSRLRAAMTARERLQAGAPARLLLIIGFTCVAAVLGVGASVFAYSYVHMQTGSVGVLMIGQSRPPIGAVAAFTFDASGPTQIDVSARGNNAGCSGTQCPVYDAGGFLTFDGRQNFLKINDSDDFSNLGQWTIVGWFRQSSGGQLVSSGAGGVSVYPLVTKSRGIAERPDVDVSFFVGVTADGKLAADFEDRNTAANHPAIGATALSAGTWHQFAAVFTGTALQVYADGTLSGSANVSVLPAVNSVVPVGIGTSFDERSVASGFFAGSLDEVEIYRQAFNAEEVRYKFQTHGLVAHLPLDDRATAQPDGGLYANTARCNGASCPTWTEDGRVFAAYQFDGVDDFFEMLDTPTLNLTEYTLALWFRATNPQARTQAVLGRGEDWAKDKAQWVIEINDPSNPRKVQLWYEATDDSDFYFPSKTDIASNTWYHVAVTRSNNGTVRLYLNGVLEHESVASVGPAVVAAPVLIGARTNTPNTYQDYFTGTIDDVRVYRQVLAANDIAYLYNLRTSFTQCQDQVDNDGDSLIDLADPGCKIPTDNNEAIATTQCQDGKDNDGDGLTDLADPGCKIPTDNNEAIATTQCQDGKDNDGDGLADLLDPGCRVATDNNEAIATTQCQDKKDNDSDIVIDLADPGCTVALGNDESAATTQCQDGKDNDSDGLTDLADPGCKIPTDNNEAIATTQCQDGKDNDGDGLVDLRDPGCVVATGNDESAATTACQDKKDNDGDGLTDMDDPGCSEPGDGDETNSISINLVNVGDTWKYFKGLQTPANWNQPSLDDSTWLSGPTGIGYDDGDDATQLGDMRGSYVTVYARKAFTLNRPDVYKKLELTVDYDDGFVAYLNGTEVARRKMGTAGTAVNKDTLAESHDAGAPETIVLPTGALIAGRNVLAVEVHNTAITSSDLSFIPSLKASQVVVDCRSIDADADGYFAPRDPGCGGGALVDCNDSNPRIFPGNNNAYCDCNDRDGFPQGRSEILGNAVDENCDGQVFECFASYPAGTTRPAECSTSNPPPRIGSFGGNLNESSGVIASHQYPGVFWVHNDSGDSNRIFATYEDGRVIREVTVDIGGVSMSGADWEDISLDPKTNEIWIADFGNNCNCRSDLKLWKVTEPNPFSDTVTARAVRYDFKYPDGSHNAEALFVWKARPYVDADINIPYIVIKGGTAGVYTFSPELKSGVTLKKIATFNSGGVLVTGADISDDGRRLALVNHGFGGAGYHWIMERSADSQDVADFFKVAAWTKTFVNEQTEEVTFLPNSYSLMTGSEQRSLWRLDPWYYEPAK
ncbi:MAG: LamG domain-containing protein [Patescibacteria group bacterium]|nr:LamG domain-containing protein [Patescibacteria group bacterium]